MPPDWQINSSMPQVTANDYEVESYAELIEHPFLLGHLCQHHFVEQGVHFTLAFSETPRCELSQLEADLRKIIAHHFSLYKHDADDNAPFAHYHFQTMLCKDGYGGLEHLDSTALLYPRGDLEPHNQEGYQTFLSLCAHELLHAWHVKRIQPICLKNPTLAEPIHTEQLWIYEGLTSFYDDFSIARAGTIQPKDYTQILAKNVTRLLRNPGQVQQSIAESSFYAWTKFYLQTPTSTNFITSYYNKGGLVALCLDILLRKESQDRYSLDDVMQILWRDYGKTGVGTADDVIATICSEQLGINIDNFIANFVRGTVELPLLQLLPYVGLALNLRASTSLQDKGGLNDKPGMHYALGGLLDSRPLGCAVQSVWHDGALAQAGVLPNDLVIAINAMQVEMGNLVSTVNQLSGNSCELSVLRDGRLLTLSMPLRPAPLDTAEVHIVDEARYLQWLTQ
jgi:predicted metalloprotease with PDZ domain